MDRFALRLALGYVDAEDEVSMLSAHNRRHPLDGVTAWASVADVLRGCYQARFDPEGLPPPRAQVLAAQSAAAIARLDAALSAAPAPSAPAR